MHNPEEVFTTLVRENRARLERICRVYAPDEAAREDLYQDILVQLWRALPSFQGGARASTWLYRVALNTALSARRHRAVRREVALDEAHARSPDWSPNPDERLEAEQRIERLYAAIDMLAPVDQALVMLYLDDKSYREMAEILGISESNVGVKLHRIKKALAAQLTEVPDDVG